MKLDHIVLMLGDLDASLPYYEALLPLIGFSKSRDHVWGNGEGVYLDLKQSPEPGEGYRRYGVGLNHLGFTAPSREAVDGIAAAMKAAGFEVPETQSLGPAYALFMKDRDGLRFEISCYG
ncbi:MAG TPA: VOC family protein [Allosphingosinicella sp.]|jgi:catechol 2,3-dioxygenase-like lactoylglutathione lyase family enzyme